MQRSHQKHYDNQIPVHMVGAVFTAAAVYVPSWNAGLGNGNDVGGLIAAILDPLGGFGKFLLVLLALTVPSASAPTMYTVCTSFMTIAKVFARVPRFVFAVISTAMCVIHCLLNHQSHLRQTKRSQYDPRRRYRRGPLLRDVCTNSQ